MAFRRFPQLPMELRLQIWECALDESLLVDSLLTNGQRPVCRVVAPQASTEVPSPPGKLVTFEDLAIGNVCRESQGVLRRHDRLYNFRDYMPTTDVVYIDDYDPWIALDYGSLRQVRHIALSADFCYDMLKIQGQSTTAMDKLGWPYLTRNSSFKSYNYDFFDHVLTCCPDIESITVVIPTLEKDMPYYADHFPVAMRPAFLNIVPYSEIQGIRIRGPYTYTSWLRGSANTKRRCLGPFIKDIKEVWGKDVDSRADEYDRLRAVTVQAGVLQYLEGPFQGKRWLSSIYKATGEGAGENQLPDACPGEVIS